MRACLAIFVSLLCQLGFAQVVFAQAIVESYETSALGVTVYPENLAMVTELRRVDVPQGISTIEFHGVTDQIVPETAVLQSFEGLRLEGNFNSDLISKASLLRAAIGETVKIRRTHPGTGQLELIDAELISASKLKNQIQGVVFKTDEGVESLQCSGLAEAILFSNLPDKLNPIPMLSMKISAEEAGPKEITLTYLTRGVSWEADYRMDVKAGEAGATLLGWLTLTNETSKSFKDAELAVVAGQVNRAAKSNNYNPTLRFTANCEQTATHRNSDTVITTGLRQGWDGSVSYFSAPPPPPLAEAPVLESGAFSAKTVSVREATRETLGDYKLYRAPQPVTVSAHQTKQIAFLLKPEIEFDVVHKRRVYLRGLPRIAPPPMPSDVEYEIDNSVDGTLAQPLPKGTLRLMSETENGQTLFSGEGSVDNLAVDLPFEVKLAESFLVTSSLDFGTDETDAGLTWKLSADVHNASLEPILAEVEFSDLSLDVINASNVERDADEALPTYRFPVAAESKETVVLDIPVEQTGEYSHTPSRYRQRPGGFSEYQDLFSIAKFRFKGRPDVTPFLAARVKPADLRQVLFTATELSVETPENKTEEREEKFLFKNQNDVSVNFTFLYNVRGRKVSLIESSLPPESESAVFWRLTVPAKSELTLTTKTRLER